MAEPFMSEIRIFSFNYSPRGWAFCNGQLLPINQNQALFALLGTTYGGDGRTTFALPNLQGATPIHRGSGHHLGEVGGEPNHTLSAAEMPSHTHAANASSSSGDSSTGAGNVLASPLNQSYGTADAPASMDPGTVADTGGGQPHPNMQPFLTLSFCIALQGIFPTTD